MHVLRDVGYFVTDSNTNRCVPRDQLDLARQGPGSLSCSGLISSASYFIENNGLVDPGVEVPNVVDVGDE